MSYAQSNGLAQRISEMKQGDHACLIYDNLEHQRAAVVPFIKAGLDRKESCLYLANERSVAEVKGVFRGQGIPVDSAVKSGALVLAETHLPDNEFSPEALVADLQSRVKSALEKGFSGFRATGEMTWVLGANCQGRDLLCYESLLDKAFPNQLVGLCQYSRKRFQPQIIRDLLRTHSVVVVGDAVCRNLYCESQDFINGEPPSDLGVGWILDNLLKFHALEEHLRHLIRVRDDFFSIASHELRTPLTALRLQNDFRTNELRNSPTLDRKQIDDFLKSNAHLIAQLQNTIEAILDASLVSKQGLSIAPEPLNLVELVEECTEHIRTSAGAEVTISLNSDGAVWGTWDRQRIGQAVRNLLSNAVKYGESKPIHVSILQNDSNAKVIVQDQGMGIDSRNQKRIFELYERAISHRSISGFGIGLFIANQVAKAHGGGIEVSSEPGLGSRFTLKVPLEAVPNSPGTQ